MNPHLQKAQLLLSQGRFEMAVEAAHQALATEPEDVDAHCVIALAQVELKKFKEAETAAGQAIGLAPDLGETHYVMARVLAARNRMKDASLAIKEAISLNPWEPDFHALAAAIASKESVPQSTQIIRSWVSANLRIAGGLGPYPSSIRSGT